MTIQILDIVLYGPVPAPRILPFRTNRMNVVTGWSKTGKSSLISIVDYCFGASRCEVPDGPIRNLTNWFALRLEVGDQQVLVARRAPAYGRDSSTEAYLQVASEVSIPLQGDLSATTNIEAVEKTLAHMAGVVDYVHEPPKGQTRSPISVSIRHALFFCLQQQDEIISRKHLFHRQSEPFIPQTIKDVLPYFLGAVEDDYLIKKSELHRLCDTHRKKLRRLRELEALRGKGASRAESLLSEAADLGVFTVPDSIDSALTWDQTVDGLRTIANSPLPKLIEDGTPDVGALYDRLVREHEEASSRYSRIQREYDTAKAILRHQNGYSKEGGEQVGRLKSIGLFVADGTSVTCPLCQGTVHETVSITEIQEASEVLEEQLAGVTSNVPHLNKMISKLEGQLSDTKEDISEKRARLDDLHQSHQRMQQYRDRLSRGAHLQGRISLYLESLPETSDEPDALRKEVENLEKKIETLEAELSSEAIEEKLDSFLAQISGQITQCGKELGLEHADGLLRLDRRKLTLVADTQDGPIPMDRIGSGANWVGYHIIVHLALHRWFKKKGRPVPQFLFLDQPSQIGFPAETVEAREEDADREAVERMLKLVWKFANDADTPFQIVVTEHADLEADWFQECVVEQWRDGKALIPQEWIDYPAKGRSS